MPESAEAFKIWDKCNETRGLDITMSGFIPLKLKPVDIKAVCDGMNCGTEVFGRIITIENIAYHKVLQENQKNAPKSQRKHR